MIDVYCLPLAFDVEEEVFVGALEYFVLGAITCSMLIGMAFELHRVGQMYVYK